MKPIIIFVFIVIFISCSQSNSEKGIINIDPRTFQESEILLSEIAEDISYIALSNKIPISHINSLIITDTLIYAATYPSGILIFNIEGEFINRIGRRGRGPGEYKYGSSFTIDSSNNLVYILDRSSKKIIVYTVQGLLKREISIKSYDGYFDDIKIDDDILYLFEGINLGIAKYNWLVIDTLGNHLFQKYNSIKTFQSGKYFLGNLPKSPNAEMYYWNQINDTIFRINNNNYTPEYLFVKGDFRMPLEKKKDYSDFAEFVNIFFTKKYLFIFYHQKKVYYSVICDLLSKDFSIVNSSTDIEKSFRRGPGVVNDLDGGMAIAPFDYTLRNEDEILIAIENAYAIKAHITTKAFKNSTPKYPEKKKALEKLANSLNDNDNPVLMLVRLKE